VIRAEDVFAGPFATTLEPDEILTEVRVPGASRATVSAYAALPQPASGYPIAGVAVVTGEGTCRIGVTGVGEQPYRAAHVEEAILAGASIADAARSIAAGQRVAADIHADREYRAAMAAVMARRAFAAAGTRLG
jgi:carbon-monoxide dehydrogenase medium subunit